MTSYTHASGLKNEEIERKIILHTAEFVILFYYYYFFIRRGNLQSLPFGCVLKGSGYGLRIPRHPQKKKKKVILIEAKVVLLPTFANFFLLFPNFVIVFSSSTSINQYILFLRRSKRLVCSSNFWISKINNKYKTSTK